MSSLRSSPVFYITQSGGIKVKKKKKALKSTAEVKHTAKCCPITIQRPSDPSMANSNFSDASLSLNEP